MKPSTMSLILSMVVAVVVVVVVVCGGGGGRCGGWLSWRERERGMVVLLFSEVAVDG